MAQRYENYPYPIPPFQLKTLNPPEPLSPPRARRFLGVRRLPCRSVCGGGAEGLRGTEDGRREIPVGNRQSTIIVAFPFPPPQFFSWLPFKHFDAPLFCRPKSPYGIVATAFLRHAAPSVGRRPFLSAAMDDCAPLQRFPRAASAKPNVPTRSLPPSRRLPDAIISLPTLVC